MFKVKNICQDSEAYIVYSVRTYNNEIQFLIYDYAYWKWVNACYYKPMEEVK